MAKRAVNCMAGRQQGQEQDQGGNQSQALKKNVGKNGGLFMAATLALDLGTKTGWAASRAMQIYSGVQSFKPNRFEGGGMRFLRFTAWLDEMHELQGIQAVYFEEVRRHAGTDAAHCYGGFLASLSAWCEGNNIPYSGVPVGTIKKHATGKGNANKQAMIEAMQALGHNPKDDNEADALALLYCALKSRIKIAP